MSMPNEIVPMILPTVMIPLTLASVGVSVVASFIAALFGIELKMEGPKKLLEVLLKPRVLASAFALNALILGTLWSWRWWNNYPKLIFTIESESNSRALPSEITYQSIPTVQTQFSSSKIGPLALQKINQLWRVEIGKGTFRAPLISEGRIFSGNDGGTISEIDLASGEIVRSFYVGTSVSSELTLWNQSLFSGEGVHDTHHARVYRFDLKSGKYTGSYQTKGHTEGQAVIGTYKEESTLFAVAGVDGLHAIDPTTMTAKWKLNIGHMDAGVLVDENSGVVFFGTGREKDDDKKNKSYAAAASFATGELLWQRELAASSWMRPVLAGSNVCFISGEIYFPSKRGHISCFDQISGEPTISHNTTEPLISTPKVLDESILYTSISGKVCRFDLKTKRDSWCFDSKGSGFSFAGASYDPRAHVVLYPSKSDGLYVLNANNGDLIMQWKPDQSEGEWANTYADVAVFGDLWIVADYVGSIRALRANFSSQMANNQ